MPRVLIIDDEKSITEMISFALIRAGFKVDVASNGIEGVNKYNKSYFDAVITDIRMPGINGNRVVHEIKKSKIKNTPVVGISGTPWELLNEEFDAILPKPCSLKALVSTVRYICHSSLQPAQIKSL